MYDGIMKDIQVLFCYFYYAFYVLVYVYVFFHFTQEGRMTRCDFCGEITDDCRYFKYLDYSTGKRKAANVCRICRNSTVMAEMILKMRKEV